jgi:D-3-phosphoglycerate dehydrogenase / 2-oxoglutarate reductase
MALTARIEFGDASVMLLNGFCTNARFSTLCPMPTFKVVLIEHGYASIACERDIITAAGGELIDAENVGLPEALRLCETADGILFRRIAMTAEMIRRFRQCKIIVRYGVGTDNVDLEAATRAKIIVGHVPLYCIDEVSTHAIALLLACVRKLVVTHARMGQGSWDVHRDDPIFRLTGKTLGIVGFGNIGRAVAQKLTGWGLRILAFDPYFEKSRADALRVQFVDFETLCRESDYVTLHCPLFPETHHLIDERSLSLMKRGAILINTARGPIVDSEALLSALDQNQIAAAALDVFEEEPLPKKSPLRNHPRIVVTDHTAWYSEESQLQLQKTAAEEIARVCTGGLPRSLANPEVLRRLHRWNEWTPPDNVVWQIKRMQRLGK